MLVMSNEMGKVSFPLIGTNDFNVKSENESFSFLALVVRTSDLKLSRRGLEGYVKEINAFRCVLHVQYDYLLSFNQSCH